ncbi:MAG TPA: DUF3592 domain-containing protein [Verrucomicrobiae bacterium]|nr:DUF3592 domain-containing protein [Verrucomicrobiae bacterium]
MIKTFVRSALVLALMGIVLGLTQTTRAEDAAKKADKHKKAEGKITAVDTNANTVTIKHKTTTETFTLAPDVKFGSGGKTLNMNISNLKVGDEVTIYYNEEGGKMIAHRVGRVDVYAKKAAKDEKKATQ